MTTIEKPSTPVEPAHGEVVTVARHRLVHLHSPGHPTGVTVSLITLDNGRNQQRPNTFGPQGLTSLDTAIDTAIAAQPDAIAITGKPGASRPAPTWASWWGVTGPPRRNSPRSVTACSGDFATLRSPPSR